MPGVPPVYTTTYTSTNSGGIRNFSGSVYLGIENFARGGETGRVIGKIVGISVSHAHSNSSNGTYRGSVALNFSDGSAVWSNSVDGYIRGWTWFTNTFYSFPEPEQFAKLGGITINLDYVSGWNPGQRTWQATREYPITVTVQFYDARDMVEGASPPTVSGVTVADAAGHLAAFGSCVQGQSRLTITGQYQLDPNYIYLSAVHTLRLTSGTTTIYTAAQTDNAVFNVGALNVSGTVAWSYNVLDTAGNSVTRTGSFAVLAYSPPMISGYAIDRYAIDVDDTGEPVYNLANDGSHVWISLNAKVSGVAGKNAWTLTLSYGADGDATGASKQIASGADAATQAFTRDRSLVTEEISPAVGWWFRLRLADRFTAVESLVMVARGAALLNIEEHGVAVGMYATGRAGAKKFEVGEDYESHFYGGIRGVTNYALGEVETGGRWFDGKKIYRKCYKGNMQGNDTLLDAALNNATLDTLVAVHGCIREGQNNMVLSVNLAHPYNGYGDNGVLVNENGVILMANDGPVSWPGAVYQVAIEYTKQEEE